MHKRDHKISEREWRSTPQNIKPIVRKKKLMVDKVLPWVCVFVVVIIILEWVSK